MSTPVNIFDIVYISYDEPNAEENWADLKQKAPWAKRVHGIKGLDNAHRAVASKAKTEYVITVDGDNIINPEFLNLSIDFEKYDAGTSFTWLGRNLINGLVYGNGGIKLWHKEFLANMDHHVNGVDFCWDKRYHHMQGIYSVTIQNGSPNQAFRAGFREGVKLSLDNGQKIPKSRLVSTLEEHNLSRLLTWCSVGADVPHGYYAIHGARLGCYLVNIEEIDLQTINDYDQIDSYFEEYIDPKEALDLELELVRKLGLNIATLDPDQSAFCKELLKMTKIGNSLPDYMRGKYILL